MDSINASSRNHETNRRLIDSTGFQKNSHSEKVKSCRSSSDCVRRFTIEGSLWGDFPPAAFRATSQNDVHNIFAKQQFVKHSEYTLATTAFLTAASPEATKPKTMETESHIEATTTQKSFNTAKSPQFRFDQNSDNTNSVYFETNAVNLYFFFLVLTISTFDYVSLPFFQLIKYFNYSFSLTRTKYYLYFGEFF